MADKPKKPEPKKSEPKKPEPKKPFPGAAPPFEKAKPKK